MLVGILKPNWLQQYMNGLSEIYQNNLPITKLLQMFSSYSDISMVDDMSPNILYLDNWLIFIKYYFCLELLK